MSLKFFQIILKKQPIVNLTRLTPNRFMASVQGERTPTVDTVHKLTKEQKDMVQGKYGVTGDKQAKKLDEQGDHMPLNSTEAYKDSNTLAKNAGGKYTRENGSDMAYTATDAVRDTLRSIKDRTVESAHNVSEAIKEKAGEMADKTKQTVGNVAQKIHEKTSQTADGAKSTEMGEAVKEKVDKAADSVKDATDKTVQQAKKSTRNYTDSQQHN